MANVVFFLGAGASAEGGCPVMSGFLSKADKVSERGGFDATQSKDYTKCKKFLSLLQQHPVVAPRFKGEEDNLEWYLENISYMATADPSKIKTTDGLPATKVFGKRNTIKDRERMLVRLISHTIERSQQFGMSSNGSRWNKSVVPPAGYSELVDCVDRLRNEGKHHVGIITFNYDLGVELALLAKSIPFAYTLSGPMPNKQTVPISKLHGSLNWLYQTKRDEPHVVPVSSLGFLDANSNPPSLTCDVTSYVLQKKIELGRVKINGRKGKAKVRKEKEAHNKFRQLIVPPSPKKDIAKNVYLQRSWKQASEDLLDAHYIVFAGYSLPVSDRYFWDWFESEVKQSVFQRKRELGIAAKVKVIDIALSQELKQRYRDLVGPGHAIDFLEQPFSRALRDLVIV